MLFIEIALTVAAWRRGWGMRALIPLVAAMFTGFLMGAAVGAAGGSIENVTPLFVLLDLACLATLIALACRAPAGVRVSEPALSLRAVEQRQAEPGSANG